MNDVISAFVDLFSDGNYPVGSGLNAMRSHALGNVHDCPRSDSASILKYKVDAYLKTICPVCLSEVSIRYENVCGGHGEYYNNLMVRCTCGISFYIRDEKSIELWNNAKRC